MKLAFLGTSEFAVPALGALVDAGHDVIAVYTRAPKPAGRGQQERRTPVHELALALAGSGDAASRKALTDNLPTSGLAVLDFAIDDWNDVAFRRGRLVRFVSPKLLKQT